MLKNICKCIIYYCIIKYICDIFGLVSSFNYIKFLSLYILNNNLYKLIKVFYNIRNKVWYYNGCCILFVYYFFIVVWFIIFCLVLICF